MKTVQLTAIAIMLTKKQIEKIWSGNLLRVLDKVQEVAKKLQ